MGMTDGCLVMHSCDGVTEPEFVGSADGTSRRNSLGPANPHLGLVFCVAAGLSLGIDLAWQWRSGWLLLLDWAPGPGQRPYTALSLPSGPAIQGIVRAAASLSARSVGWGVVTAGVLLTYAGGVRLARCWRGPDGARLSWWAATVGGCVAVTNPFVSARVYSGQISVIWGCAAIWWLTAALVDSSSRRSPWAPILPALLCALAAAFSLHLLGIGIVVAVLSSILQSREIGRRAALGRAVTFVTISISVTAAWLVPALLVSGSFLGTSGGEAGVRLFSSGGPASTLWLRAAGGAGFWRPLPEGTLNSAGLVIAAAWIATLVIAWPFGRGWSRNFRHLLVGCALVAILTAYLGRGPTTAPWSWLVETVSIGLFREPGKIGTLAILFPACGAAAAAQRLFAWRSTFRLPAARSLSVGLIVGSVVAMLSTWSNLAGSLTTSEYPPSWEAAREAVATDDCAIAVLGDGAYTDPGFTGGRIVADPAAGFFGYRAIVSLDPLLEGIESRPARTPAGRWSAVVNDRYLDGQALQADPSLAATSGVGWVFVSRPADRLDLAEALTAGGFTPVVESEWAGLWRTPGGCR